MRRTFSLQGRLALAMAFVFVLGVGASVIFYYVEIGAAANVLRERSLRGQARDVLEGLKFNASDEATIELSPDWAQVYAQHDSGFSFTLFDPQGVDKYKRAADYRSGAWSILTGIAGNHALIQKRAIRIDDLIQGLAIPDYPSMPDPREAMDPLPLKQSTAIRG